MERVDFPEQVITAFREAARGTGWGEACYSVGGRMRGGSWFALIASLLFAVVIGGLTTWLLVFLWPEVPFQGVMALSFGYLMTLLTLWLAWAYRPGARHPATWVVVWEEGLAWLSEGGAPVVLAWNEIAGAWHTVTSVRDQYGKEFRRDHRLEVQPAADPTLRGRLRLDPGFPCVAEIAAFVTARVYAR
ncbi:hypothetical protein [Streptomyces sp. HO565]|uniref:hypothetical protein n=1 Tax=Streptomyces sp. HO565 TaxID=2857489 RepID=UPI0034DC1037